MRKSKKLQFEIGDKIYFFDKKTNLETYKELCYLVYTEYQGDIKMLFSYLMKLSKVLFPNIDLPFDTNKEMTDREYLDICIEAYQALYFLFAGKALDYRDLTDYERFKVFQDDKLMNLLLTYKMEKYGKEILNNLGFEMVGKVEQGYIIRDLDQDNKPIN